MMERWKVGRMEGWKDGLPIGTGEANSNRHRPVGLAHCVGGHAVYSEGGEVEEMEVGRMERLNDGMMERWRNGGIELKPDRVRPWEFLSELDRKGEVQRMNDGVLMFVV